MNCGYGKTCCGGCVFTAPFRMIGTALGNLSENLEREARFAEGRRSRAKRAESEAKEKYAGTRVVEVALKIYKFYVARHEKSIFWLLDDHTRSQYFELAKEELLADKNCWNLYHMLTGRLLNMLLHPVAWCIYKINNGFSLSMKWHCRLWHWHSMLDSNWCRVPFDKVYAAKQKADLIA